MTSPVLFQFMPPLLPSEYQALTESIRGHGVQVPVIVDENGAIIDGHHRDQIATELGVACPRVVRDDLTDAEKRTLAISLNKDRRHLTREQVRALIAESIKADPDLSDRAHAQRTGASHPTVGKVRAELEQVERFTTSPAERIDPLTGEIIDPTDVAMAEIPEAAFEAALTQARADEDMSAEHVLDLGRRITGLDGKSYTRPEKPSETAARTIEQRTDSRKPPRTPLRDGFRDAALDLGKLVARFERLVADDRLARNKNEVARYANDLTRASEALQRLADQLTN